MTWKACFWQYHTWKLDLCRILFSLMMFLRFFVGLKFYRFSSCWIQFFIKIHNGSLICLKSCHGTSNVCQPGELRQTRLAVAFWKAWGILKTSPAASLNNGVAPCSVEEIRSLWQGKSGRELRQNDVICFQFGYIRLIEGKKCIPVSFGRSCSILVSNVKISLISCTWWTQTRTVQRLSAELELQPFSPLHSRT